MAASGNSSPNSKGSLLANLWELHGGKLAFAGGALLALGAYKLFREGEADLERRLLRYRRGKKKIRIYIDGCWDLMHFGHANAFRQARELGDELVVGINMGWEIEKIKGGPPIMTDEERKVAVQGCKWVDEVIDDAPYTMNAEFLERLFNEYKIDYVVHGDDPCLLPDGSDVYAEAKASGRFKNIKRTEGVSTTDIVGRMLVMNRAHHRPVEQSEGGDHWAVAGDFEYQLKHGFSRPSNFLPTTHRLREFSNNRRPKSGDRIVYIDGAFDMFHAGHVEILEKAKACGDYLVVGVVSDEAVNAIRGSNYPILNLHERALSVLSCRFVDEVIFGAPWKPTQSLLKSLNVSIVVHGEVTDDSEPLQGRPAWQEHYAEAENLGIGVRQLPSGRQLTTRDIVDRIFKNRQQFEDKFTKKKAQEDQYNESKEYVPEI